MCTLMICCWCHGPTIAPPHATSNHYCWFCRNSWSSKKNVVFLQKLQLLWLFRLVSFSAEWRICFFPRDFTSGRMKAINYAQFWFVRISKRTHVFKPSPITGFISHLLSAACGEWAACLLPSVLSQEPDFQPQILSVMLFSKHWRFHYKRAPA